MKIWYFLQKFENFLEFFFRLWSKILNIKKYEFVRSSIGPNLANLSKTHEISTETSNFIENFEKLYESF